MDKNGNTVRGSPSSSGNFPINWRAYALQVLPGYSELVGSRARGWAGGTKVKIRTIFLSLTSAAACCHDVHLRSIISIVFDGTPCFPTKLAKSSSKRVRTVLSTVISEKAAHKPHREEKGGVTQRHDCHEGSVDRASKCIVT